MHAVCDRCVCLSIILTLENVHSLSMSVSSSFLYTLYDIPLQRDYAARKTDFLARLKETFADIEKPLTRENYKEKFHLLLCWEEKTHIEILEERLFILLIDVYSCADN